MTLTPCTACARHVRSSERACPFCGAACVHEIERARVVTERLGRAALFSLGAATMVTSAIGCGAKSQLPEPAAYANDAALGDAGATFAHYGGPPVVAPDAGPDADLGCCSADYGGPPWP